VLYSTDDGKIYTMAADSTEGVKVGTYSNSAYMEAISNDGTISVWTLKSTDGVLSIVLNEGEEKTELGDVDYKYDYTNVSFTSDQGLVVITNTYSDTMWIKTPGADVEKVKLGNDIYRSNVFTANGYLSDQTTAKVDSIYALVEADSGCNVYNVTLSGDRERALSKVSNAYFANGNIIYEDQDKNLYYAAVKGADFEDGIKIASDVDSFKISDNGKYVYYMKDCENNEGSLYAYQIGKIEPKKIGSNIGCYVSSYWSYGYYQISEDGSSVYYEKDVEEIADTYSSYGTLMKWSYTSEESERISSDVIVNSLQSALKSGEVKDKGFMFLKYSSVDSDDNIIYDWMFYNGTESIKLASDVIK
jgi:hypothetical protein